MSDRAALRAFLCGLGVSLLLAGASGCGGGGTTSVGPTLVTLTINPASSSLAVGQSQQFSATGSYSDGTTKDLSTSVTWRSSNSAAVAISSSGLATAIEPATLVVTAVTAGESMSASAKVTAAYVGVLMYHNDVGSTGQNLNETILKPSNVNATQFGKLFSYPVDGAVYAQPLYVQSVTIPSQGAHNVVYVATQHDSVYAFDADGKSPNPLWHVSFLNSPGVVPVPAPAPNLYPGLEIGIPSTPVIDGATGTLYVVAYTFEPPGVYVYRLHALDITTGAEKFGSPVVVQGTVSGTGVASDGEGHVAFVPGKHLQRAALLLSNGTLYLAFASHDDSLPFNGWLFAFDSQMLKQTGVFNSAPNAWGAGIWQSGAGPVADAAGNVYLTTGNGAFDASMGGQDYGDSVVQFPPGGVLNVSGYFTPFDQANLAEGDLDLASGGVLVVPDQAGPHPHLLIAGGKEGTVYVLDREDLGGYNPQDNSQIVQSVPKATTVGFFCTPAFWENNIYYMGIYDSLKQYQLTNGLLSTPVAQSSAGFQYPGATPSISANGSTNGIVWAIDTSANAQRAGPAVLHAFDATNVGQELYNTNQAATRDQPGGAVKFAVPTIFNGKVYIGTTSELDVYGLLGATAAAVR